MDKLLNYGPWLYALLVLAGFLNLHYYYESFGLDIWTYLSTGELLLSFLTLVEPIALTACLVLGYTVFVSRRDAALVNAFIGGYEELLEAILRLPDTPFRKIITLSITHWRSFIAGMLLLVLAILMVLSTILLLFVVSNGRIYPWFEGVISLGAIMTLMGLMLWYVRVRSKNQWYGQVVLGTLLVIYPLVLIAASSRESANELKLGEVREFVSFTMDNQFFNSDTVLVYLGKTNSHMFLYNRMDSTAHIFQMDGVSHLTVQLGRHR